MANQIPATKTLSESLTTCHTTTSKLYAFISSNRSTGSKVSDFRQYFGYDGFLTENVKCDISKTKRARDFDKGSFERAREELCRDVLSSKIGPAVKKLAMCTNFLNMSGQLITPIARAQVRKNEKFMILSCLFGP